MITNDYIKFGEDILKQFAIFGDRINMQLRITSISLIMISWGILLSRPEKILVFGGNLQRELLQVSILAFGALFCNYMQDFWSYLHIRTLNKKHDEQKLEVGNYHYTDWRYRLRAFFFWVKQGVLSVAVIWFFSILIRYSP